jgi:hypothetical protein
MMVVPFNPVNTYLTLTLILDLIQCIGQVGGAHVMATR